MNPHPTEPAASPPRPDWTRLHHRVDQGRKVMKHAFWLCAVFGVIMVAFWAGTGPPTLRSPGLEPETFLIAAAFWGVVGGLWFVLWRWSRSAVRRALGAGLVYAGLSLGLMLLARAPVPVLITGFIVVKLWLAWRAARRLSMPDARIAPEVFD